MKKILLLTILLFNTVLFCQESHGYILDGTYMIGDVPHGLFIDTLNQAYAESSVSKAMKFRNVVDSSAVLVNNDTIIKVLYSGMYFIYVQFTIDNPEAGGELNSYRILSTWINKSDDSRCLNSKVNHIIHDINELQTFSFSNLLRLEDNSEIKIMHSLLSDGQSLTTSSPQTAPARPQQPSTKLIIYKISDL